MHYVKVFETSVLIMHQLKVNVLMLQQTAQMCFVGDRPHVLVLNEAVNSAEVLNALGQLIPGSDKKHSEVKMAKKSLLRVP